MCVCKLYINVDIKTNSYQAPTKTNNSIYIIFGVISFQLGAWKIFSMTTFRYEFIHIYIYMCVCVCVCIYIYIYIHK